MLYLGACSALNWPAPSSLPLSQPNTSFRFLEEEWQAEHIEGEISPAQPAPFFGRLPVHF